MSKSVAMAVNQIACIEPNADAESGDIENMKIELSLWRNTFSVERARRDCVENKNREDMFTVAELCSGGCLDTISALRVGFKHMWSSEIDTAQSRMYRDLTGNKCLGDTFGAAVKSAARVHYLKTGQPCTDWARSGKSLGSKGDTGWMFVKQTEIILSKRPQVFRLEISDNAPNVNAGKDVDAVITALSDKYVIYKRMIEVWRFGDPSNRKRLFIVGVDKRLGQVSHDFHWPKPSFDGERVPTARTIAVKDSEIPDSYWRHDDVNEQEVWDHGERADRIQVIARQGVGMGSAAMPHIIRSWDGLLNGPTSLGGGGRGPELDWQSGKPLKRTRLTVPVEFNRAASNPDDYIDWCKSFAQGNADAFILRCINNGVPLRTGCAIDEQVMRVLRLGQLRATSQTEVMASAAWQYQSIRQMMFDTGANGCINFRDVESWMLNASESNTRITVANGKHMAVGMDGTLPIRVLNTAGITGVEYEQDFSIQTTTADSALELFSFDPLYRNGWGLHILPSHIDGGRAEIYRPAKGDDRAIKIPLRYDWAGNKGGFWIDYLLINNATSDHSKLLAAFQVDMSEQSDPRRIAKFYDEASSLGIVERGKVSVMVADVLVGQHDMDRQIRGVKLGLKTDRQKMSEAQFHDNYGHLGCKADCAICRMVKGAARRIRKVVDSHREIRVAYKFHMDTVTFSDRSSQGSKFCTVMRCEASDTFVAFNQFLKSDIVDMFSAWVDVMRADPVYFDCGYKVVSVVCLDNAGEWALKTERWKELGEKKGIHFYYSCPDRKESSARPERSVGIVEIVTKALLMQNNLPVWWWEFCLIAAVFLLNRFPTTNLSAMGSIDGDRVRPLEMFTRFNYSRRQIDRELSYFLAPGTPAMVQTTAKGSALMPKTRWGVATGMYREQVMFMCPYVLSEFRSKSFAAFRLKDGLNYLQFLNLAEVRTARGRLSIPTDFKEIVDVQLTAHNSDPERPVVKPITEVVLSGEFELNPPVIRVSKKVSGELGGEVRVTDPTGQFESSFGELGGEAPWGEAPGQFEGSTERAQSGGAHTAEDAGSGNRDKRPRPKTDKGDRLIIDLTMSADVKALFDRADAEAALKKGVTTTGVESFVAVCKSMALPFERHNLYREWLIATVGFQDDVLVTGRSKLKPGMCLPYPTGCKWQELIAQGSRKQRRAHHVDFSPEEDAEYAAELWLEELLQEQNAQVAAGGR
jgi:site-specific DNA-cytosine methylase